MFHQDSCQSLFDINLGEIHLLELASTLIAFELLKFYEYEGLTVWYLKFYYIQLSKVCGRARTVTSSSPGVASLADNSGTMTR